MIYHQGHLKAVMDMEMACIGDPLLDLCCIRMRDLSEKTGSAAAITRRYAELSGKPLDMKTLRFHLVAFSAVSSLLISNLLFAPTDADRPFRISRLLPRLAAHRAGGGWRRCSRDRNSTTLAVNRSRCRGRRHYASAYAGAGGRADGGEYRHGALQARQGRRRDRLSCNGSDALWRRLSTRAYRDDDRRADRHDARRRSTEAETALEAFVQAADDRQA